MEFLMSYLQTLSIQESLIDQIDKNIMPLNI